jgi:CxxC-x17-CxxC domain-containing protein
MNNFRDGGFKKGGRDFGGKPRFGEKRTGGFGGGERRRSGGFNGGDRGGRDGGSSELFAATCSACSKPCEVPFRPSGDKPVFCSACFNKKSASDERGSGRDYANRGDSRQHKAPSFEKPYHEHRPSYEAAPQVAKNTDLIDMKRQLATIESRLNRILDLLNPPTPPSKARVAVAEVAPVVVEEALPKKERKPKTVKAPAKKAAKKAVKKAAKKVAKKAAK